MKLAAPEYLALFAVLALLIAWLRGRRHHMAIHYPDANRYHQTGESNGPSIEWINPRVALHGPRIVDSRTSIAANCKSQVL